MKEQGNRYIYTFEEGGKEMADLLGALFYEIKYGDSQGLILIDNAGTNPTVGDQGQESVEKFMLRLERVSPKNDMDIMREERKWRTFWVAREQVLQK